MRHLDNYDLIQQQANMVQCINKKCLAMLPAGAVYCLVCGRRQTSESRKYHKRAHGTGTIYRLQGRRKRPWVVAKDDIIIDYFETRAAAEMALSQLIGQKIPPKYNWTFTQVFDAWKAEHFREIKHEGGIESYETAYKHYNALHDRIFRELEHTDYQSPIDEHEKRAAATPAAIK